MVAVAGNNLSFVAHVRATSKFGRYFTGVCPSASPACIVDVRHESLGKQALSTMREVAPHHFYDPSVQPPFLTLARPSPCGRITYRPCEGPVELMDYIVCIQTAATISFFRRACASVSPNALVNKIGWREERWTIASHNQEERERNRGLAHGCLARITWFHT